MNNKSDFRNRRSRKMYKPGNGESWICNKCGKEIESLPFMPYKDKDGNWLKPVYHRECLPGR